MRKLFILLIGFALVGCSTQGSSIEEIINKSVKEVSQAPLSVSNNYRKKMFTYHLPQDIGVLESNNISSVLLYGDSNIFMSVNVSEVMSNGARNLSVGTENLISKDFILPLRDNVEKSAVVHVEQLGRDSYLVYFEVDDVFFLSVSQYANIENILERMLMIGRTLEVDKKMIISEFSNKETLTYKKEVIELFSDSIPKDGMIQDIITNDEDGD